MNSLRFITFVSSLFVGSLGIAQQGDKANEKDIISSLNWKKWSPDVVPVFTAEESLASNLKWHRVSKWNWSQQNPWSRILFSSTGMTRAGCGLEN
jgi:hypothetical protein